MTLCLAVESASSFTEVKVQLFLCAQVNHLSIARVEPGKIKKKFGARNININTGEGMVKIIHAHFTCETLFKM